MKKFLSIILIIFIFAFTCANAAIITYNPQKIKVYIPQKDMLTVTMKHAFMDWQRHANNKIAFEYVGTKSTADIEVIFVENNISNICGKDAIGCNKTVSAKTRRGNDKRVDSKVYISMRDHENKAMTKNEVYSVMLHEIGHALGLKHSEDVTSIMYKASNAAMAEKQEIRQQDIDALYKYYGLE